MHEQNGAAPGPATAAVDPDLDLVPSPTYRGIPIDKAADVMLLELLKESQKQTIRLDQIAEAFSQIAAALEGLSSSPMLSMFGGKK